MILHSEISARIAGSFPDLQETLDLIVHSVGSGLWHEASMLLFKVVDSRAVCRDHGELLYEAFVRRGVLYMNPISHASVVLQITAGIASDKSLKVFEDAIAAQKRSHGDAIEAIFALQCGEAVCHIENSIVSATSTSILRDAQSYIAARDGQAVSPLLSVQVNLLKFRTAWMKSDFHEAMKAGMKLYEYRETQWTAHVCSPDDLWAKTALAAVLDPESIEFGGLFQKKAMINSLRAAVPKAYDLLVCMHAGDRIGSSAVLDDGVDFLRTPACIHVLREKVMLTSFLHYVHRLPRGTHELTFDEISAACTCTKDAVEFLLLNALERGVVAGKIDGRTLRFQMENMQPKYLTQSDIGDLIIGVDALIGNVAMCEAVLT